MATEAALEPERPIIDPHHHLWDLSGLLASMETVPFPEHGFSQMIQQHPQYLLPELLRDIQDSGHNIQATVFMECGAMYRAAGPEAYQCLGETEFVNGVAAMAASGLYGNTLACTGIIGHVDLRLGKQAGDVLRRQIDAGNGRFRGIRHGAPYDADSNVLGPLSVIGGMPEGLYRDPDFRQGFAELAPLGLTFDAWIIEPQLPDLLDLARAFPETRIVLDHVGGIVGMAAYQDQRGERWATWHENIKALAQCDNVCVKLGGLAMPFAGFPWSVSNRPDDSRGLAEAWRPYIEACIEAFGPQRCMFESNFPVDSYSCDYGLLWNAFKRITQSYSERDKSALYFDTANQVYRLGLE